MFDDLTQEQIEYVAENCCGYTEDEMYEKYDEMLDDCYLPVSVCGMAYNVSYVLRECDPTAYRCGFSDWLDAESHRIVEIAGQYYDVDEVEAAIEDYEDEHEDDLED